MLLSVGMLACNFLYIAALKLEQVIVALIEPFFMLKIVLNKFTKIWNCAQ